MWDMGLEFVPARGTENPTLKEGGKLLNVLESNFVMDWKTTGGRNGGTERTERCRENRAGKVLQDFTCKMLPV